mgnify:CR=1 FL=1
MTISNIIGKTEDDLIFNPYEVKIEYKEIDFEYYVIHGFFKEGTETPHGICRKIQNNNEYEDDGIKEGMIVNG